MENGRPQTESELSVSDHQFKYVSCVYSVIFLSGQEICIVVKQMLSPVHPFISISQSCVNGFDNAFWSSYSEKT